MDHSCVPSVASGRAERVVIPVKKGPLCEEPLGSLGKYPSMWKETLCAQCSRWLKNMRKLYEVIIPIIPIRFHITTAET